MITQTITASMTQTSLSKILTRRYDVGREIKFILYKDELLSDPIDLTDYTVVITVIKPDNNFVIENFVGDTVTITEQMEVVTGTGYYCVHVTKGTETIYTGQGEFIIDDVLISDDELESISEVNGLKFPDDFITVEDHVAVIDDTVTSIEKTWSSSKISDEIENASVIVSKTAEGNPVEISDAADAPLVECVTEIQGSQDLHGQDKPWVGGAGKNKAPMTVRDIKSVNVRGTWSGNAYTLSGVTFTILTDSAENVIGIKLYGLANDTVDFIPTNSYFTLPANSYILNGCSNGSSSTYRLNLYKVVSDGNKLITQSLNGDSPSFTLSGDENLHSHLYISQGVQVDTVIYPMIRLATESDSTFTPYSNICPITAYTEVEIEVTDGDGNSTTHTTTFPYAIYRGSEDVVNGEVTGDMPVIDLGDLPWSAYSADSTGHSFYVNVPNGTKSVSSDSSVANMVCENYETVAFINPSEWLRRDAIICQVPNAQRWIVRDERYSDVTSFTSSISGVKLACELATPTTSSVTPSNLPIKSISGYANIESTTGNIEIEYITQDCQPLVDSIVMESERKITKLWDAGFTPSPGVWLEYDFGEDLENYDAIVILFVVSGWEGNNSDSVTVYPKIQNLNTTKYYHYIKGADYGIQFWHVSGTIYGLGSIDGNYPPQYKAVYGIKY